MGVFDVSIASVLLGCRPYVIGAWAYAVAAVMTYPDVKPVGVIVVLVQESLSCVRVGHLMSVILICTFLADVIVVHSTVV